jgi:valyl-tRNA synthetase
MEDFQFAEAQRQIYEFLWSEFCDWYIELAKIRLRSNTEGALTSLTVLVYVLETSLRLLHPFMPFVTEELWQNLKGDLSPAWQASESLMIAPYPEADTRAVDVEAERIMTSVIEIIRAIRNTRAQYNVESNRWIEAQVYSGQLTAAVAPYTSAIETLARARPVTLSAEPRENQAGENMVVSVLTETEVVIPMESMVDREVERKRLEKEIEESQLQVARLEARLEDGAFLTKAPVAVVDRERSKLYTLSDKLERLKQKILDF